MKRFTLAVICLTAAASLSGCSFISEFKESYKEALRENIREEIAAELESASENNSDSTDSENSISDEYTDNASEDETSPEKQVCTVGYVTFTADGSWEPLEGYEGSFTENGGKAVYQLQGSSMLGSYEPQEFFNQLADYYQESHTVIYKDEALTSHTAPDGTECFIGRIELTKDMVAFYIDVLIAPDKNMAVTFASQCAEGNEPSTDIREITETAQFNIGTEDMLSGKRFTTSDDTAMYLEDDGTFRYCESASDPDNAYFSGTYEVYRGQEAFDKLVSMTEYGLTEEELEQTLAANMNGYSVGGSMPYDYFDDNSSEEGYLICKDTFYALVMDTDSIYEDGVESPVDAAVLYFGYYVDELGIFDLLNANSISYSQWTPVE